MAKIVVVSSFRPDYPVGLEGSYCRALQTLGHVVHPLSTLPPASLASSAERHRRGPSLRAQILALEPDLVVLVKALNVPASAISHLRRSGSMVVNVFPDNFWEASAPLHRSALAQLRTCSRVYLHDRFLVGQLRQVGVHGEYISFARDPLLHSPRTQSRKVYPIVFIGNPDAERVRYLRAVNDLGLNLWGRWDWARLPPSDPLSDCIRGSEVVGGSMADVLSQSAVSINILRCSQKTAHNMRTFDSPSCGVCTISERSVGVLELMKEGLETITFDSPAGLRRACLNLLGSPTQRDALAQAGWSRVRNDTYEVRAAHILDDLGIA